MHVLRIEHQVGDYEAWKKVFDDDPLGRKGSGVLRHRVARAVDDPGYVMIDLEFATADEAQRMHEALTQLWARVDVVNDPRARAAEIVEVQDY